MRRRLKKDFLKIDIEENKLKALVGAEKMLNECRIRSDSD